MFIFKSSSFYMCNIPAKRGMVCARSWPLFIDIIDLSCGHSGMQSLAMAVDLFLNKGLVFLWNRTRLVIKKQRLLHQSFSLLFFKKIPLAVLDTPCLILFIYFQNNVFLEKALHFLYLFKFTNSNSFYFVPKKKHLFFVCF